MATTTTEIHSLSGIRSRVLNQLHRFAANTYYELAFSGAAESVFEGFRNDVDQRLAAIASGASGRFPSVSERLATGDSEAISHAMTSCRRIIDAFADAVYPPREEPLTANGREIQLGPSHHLNRLTVFVQDHCSSTSRYDRLRKTLREIYTRVSAGVHSDVTADEARALYVQTYLTIGEIALLSSAQA